MSLNLLQEPRDLLRQGPGSVKSDRKAAVHPVDAIQRAYAKQDQNSRRYMVANIYGSHFPVRLQMEEAILSGLQRTPGLGLPASNLALETLMGLDDSIEFEDYLKESRMLEQPVDDILSAMEMRLGENLNSVLQ